MRIPASILRLTHLEIPRELAKWVFQRHGSGLNDSHADGVVGQVFSRALWRVIENLGPVYGKAMQIWLSSLPADKQQWIGLGQIFDGWSPMSHEEFCEGLSKAIPDWRDHLASVSHEVLGVASMAEVREAIGHDGSVWVVKLLKPKSLLRLDQTLSAMDQLLQILRPLCSKGRAKRSWVDLESLISSYRKESDLRIECESMEKMRKHLEANANASQVFLVPRTHKHLVSEQALVMERLDGRSISSLIGSGKSLSSAEKKRLSEKIVQEVLVQIFELGFYHADPHGGNLLLLQNGKIGLIDWGLAGTLVESDRKFLARVLRSVVTRNKKSLLKAFEDLAIARDEPLTEKQTHLLKSELEDLESWAKERKLKKEPVTLAGFVNRALAAAEKVELDLPSSLLLMVKTLVTIEGVAKGLDTNISLTKVGLPVLLRAFRPSMSDFLGSIGKLGSFFTRGQS